MAAIATRSSMHSPTHPAPKSSNYDAKADLHDMVLGSLALLHELVGVVIAYLQWQQNRRTTRLPENAVEEGDSIRLIEVPPVGMSYCRCIR